MGRSTSESRATVTEGHRANAPATFSLTRSEGRLTFRLPLLGMCSRSSSRCAPEDTCRASTSVPRSSTADAGVSLSVTVQHRQSTLRETEPSFVALSAPDTKYSAAGNQVNFSPDWRMTCLPGLIMAVPPLCNIQFSFVRCTLPVWRTAAMSEEVHKINVFASKHC